MADAAFIQIAETFEETAAVEELPPTTVVLCSRSEFPTAKARSLAQAFAHIVTIPLSASFAMGGKGMPLPNSSAPIPSVRRRDFAEIEDHSIHYVVLNGSRTSLGEEIVIVAVTVPIEEAPFHAASVLGSIERLLYHVCKGIEIRGSVLQKKSALLMASCMAALYDEDVMATYGRGTADAWLPVPSTVVVPALTTAEADFIQEECDLSAEEVLIFSQIDLSISDGAFEPFEVDDGADFTEFLTRAAPVIRSEPPADWTSTQKGVNVPVMTAEEDQDEADLIAEEEEKAALARDLLTLARRREGDADDGTSGDLQSLSLSHSHDGEPASVSVLSSEDVVVTPSDAMSSLAVSDLTASLEGTDVVSEEEEEGGDTTVGSDNELLDGKRVIPEVRVIVYVNEFMECLYEGSTLQWIRVYGSISMAFDFSLLSEVLKPSERFSPCNFQIHRVDRLNKTKVNSSMAEELSDGIFNVFFRSGDGAPLSAPHLYRKPVKLVKYDLKVDAVPELLRCMTAWKIDEKRALLHLHFALNPRVGITLKELGFLVKVRAGSTQNGKNAEEADVSENVEGPVEAPIGKVHAKPAGNWNSETSKLLWQMSDPLTPDAPPAKLMAVWETASALSPLPAIVKFVSPGSLLSEIDVELFDAERKDNSVIPVSYVLHDAHKTLRSGRFELRQSSRHVQASQE